MNIVRDTVASARAEYRRSPEGRLSTYVDSLPPIPHGTGDAAGRLHASSIEILRAHAEFIGRLLAEAEGGE
jgi:hypothetical protein